MENFKSLTAVPQVSAEKKLSILKDMGFCVAKNYQGTSEAAKHPCIHDCDACRQQVAQDTTNDLADELQHGTDYTYLL